MYFLLFFLVGWSEEYSLATQKANIKLSAVRDLLAMRYDKVIKLIKDLYISSKLLRTSLGSIHWRQALECSLMLQYSFWLFGTWPPGWHLPDWFFPRIVCWTWSLLPFSTFIIWSFPNSSWFPARTWGKAPLLGIESSASNLLWWCCYSSTKSSRNCVL